MTDQPSCNPLGPTPNCCCFNAKRVPKCLQELMASSVRSLVTVLDRSRTSQSWASPRASQPEAMEYCDLQSDKVNPLASLTELVSGVGKQRRATLRIPANRRCDRLSRRVHRWAPGFVYGSTLACHTRRKSLPIIGASWTSRPPRNSWFGMQRASLSATRSETPRLGGRVPADAARHTASRSSTPTFSIFRCDTIGAANQIEPAFVTVFGPSGKPALLLPLGIADL